MNKGPGVGWAWLGPSLAVAVLLLAGTPGAWAQTYTYQTLHLCPSGGACPAPNTTVGGVQIVTTTSTLPTFGVVRSPNTNSGLSGPVMYLAVFVPSQTPNLSFTANFGGASASTSAPVSSTPWTSGPLLAKDTASYLGSSLLALVQCNGCGPASPISAFLGASQAVNPGTTGYDVYVLNLGSVSFPTSSTFSFSSITAFPVGTVFYAFLVDTSGANSGFVSDTTAPSSSIVIVPEPGTMALLGTGLLSVAALLRRRLGI